MQQLRAKHHADFCIDGLHGIQYCYVRRQLFFIDRHAVRMVDTRGSSSSSGGEKQGQQQQLTWVGSTLVGSDSNSMLGAIRSRDHATNGRKAQFYQASLTGIALEGEHRADTVTQLRKLLLAALTADLIDLVIEYAINPEHEPASSLLISHFDSVTRVTLPPLLPLQLW